MARRGRQAGKGPVGAGQAEPDPGPPAEPAGSGGAQASNGHGQDDPPAMPFWLRPIRRDK